MGGGIDFLKASLHYYTFDGPLPLIALKSFCFWFSNHFLYGFAAQVHISCLCIACFSSPLPSLITLQTIASTSGFNSILSLAYVDEIKWKKNGQEWSDPAPAPRLLCIQICIMKLFVFLSRWLSQSHLGITQRCPLYWQSRARCAPSVNTYAFQTGSPCLACGQTPLKRLDKYANVSTPIGQIN